ncbi:MAG: hypothetical protein OEQ53_17645, partial [Saprospiraceae bacterium]|nr:hypothetical protein [Saprospiraceae bacterium]
MKDHQLARQLRTVFNGKAWYGKNVSNTLQGIPYDKVLRRMGASHNIAELVHHMMAWHNYVIHVILNREHLEVSDAVNFPKITTLSEV